MTYHHAYHCWSLLHAPDELGVPQSEPFIHRNGDTQTRRGTDRPAEGHWYGAAILLAAFASALTIALGEYLLSKAVKR